MCIFLWQFHRPEVALCGGRDVKIQLLSNLAIKRSECILMLLLLSVVFCFLFLSFVLFVFLNKGVLTWNLQHWVRIIYCVVVNILFDFLSCQAQVSCALDWHVPCTLAKIAMISHPKILPVSTTLFHVISFLKHYQALSKNVLKM